MFGRFVREYWRRRPDLNRGWRFCRPLPYHLATAPVGEPDWTKESRPCARTRTTACPAAGQEVHALDLRATFAEKWSGKRDSNPRLRPWQGRTLPLSYSRSPGPPAITEDGQTTVRKWQCTTAPAGQSRQRPAQRAWNAERYTVMTAFSPMPSTATTSKRQGRSSSR